MAQWRKSTPDEVYTADEIQARLSAELPKWTYEDGWIRRKYKTSGWKATLMVVNTVGHLAEAAWHHPDLTVSYAFVNVKLMNHAAKGITDKDFALAAKIEEVLMWRPGAEPGSVLEGTPDDPRFKYLKYDQRGMTLCPGGGTSRARGLQRHRLTLRRNPGRNDACFPSRGVRQPAAALACPPCSPATFPCPTSPPPDSTA